MNLDAGLEWLRFVTPYYYADAARIFSGQSITAPLITGCIVCTACAGFGLWRYGRKDIAA